MQINLKKSVDIIKYLTPSALTFFLGAGSLIIVDIILGRYAADADLNDWILLKSLMLPLATLALLGTDQVIVREPSKTHHFIKPIICLALIIAFLSTIAAHMTGFYTKYIILFCAIIGIASTYLFFGMFRAILSFNMAQFARDGWKFIFLIALLPFYFLWGLPIDWILVGALAITMIACAWVKYFSENKVMNEVHNEVHSFKSALNVGWPFCMAAFALSIASYGELLLLRGFGGIDILPQYFRATILFAMPFVVLNTYIATFLGSAIRQSPKKFATLMIRYRWTVMAVIMVFPLLAMAFGYAISPLLFPDHETPFLWALLLSITACMRLAYSMPSSFIGALSNRPQVTAISLYYLLCAVLTPLICFVLYYVTADLAVSVATTGALHWVARSIAGWGLTMRLCNSKI